MLQYMDSFLGWEYDHLPPNELLDVDTEGSFPSRAGGSSGVRRRVQLARCFLTLRQDHRSPQWWCPLQQRPASSGPERHCPERHWPVAFCSEVPLAKPETAINPTAS